MLIVAFSLAIVLGVLLGVGIAVTRNAAREEVFVDHNPPLPTKVLDRYDRVITTFFGSENRQPVTIDQVPQYLIQALITKEDRNFYSHHGFSVRGLLRAVFNIVTGQYVSGASTLTQQLAGQLKHIRNDISIRRKVVELWDAVQLERRYTKQEILEMYLNEMPFGSGNVGIEAASEFYFGHPVQEDTLAESVMLVIQLSSPALNSPIKHPERARPLQKKTLDDMVKLGYVTRAEADNSFNQYWASYDTTRANSSAFLDREDLAPYFSEYIRGLVEDSLLGAYDVNTDGLVIHTTLDLDYQRIADERMAKDIDDVNAQYLKLSGAKLSSSNASLLPIIDMLGFTFDIDDLMNRTRNAAGNAKRDYAKRVAPEVEALASIFSIPQAQDIISAGIDKSLAVTRTTQVQGALVSIDPSNGYILAMVGGRKFSRSDQFNRAVQARVPPGSFKPLYYSAAIDSRKFTAASRILDAPVKFTNADGTLYEPLNYKGKWVGPVLLRDALANSMNVPSLKVLDGIGFDAAIERSSRMLGITDPIEMAKRHFDRVYPLGLGEPVAISPLEMARAYSTFVNGGREVVPVAIRYIEDRNGKIIDSPAQKTLAAESRKGNAAQIMSPQTAYIMTSLLQSTLTSGTLSGEPANILNVWDDKGMAFAGKTGTTQNWENAWTIGFSPYVTTAVWYGFDEGNRSLGTELTGAAIAGPTWAKYMADIHKNLQPKRFTRPDTGLVDEVVSSTSGLLPSDFTTHKRTEVFLAGTEPRTVDTMDEEEQQTFENIYEYQKNTLLNNPTVPGPGEITLPPVDTSGGSTTPATNPLLD